MKFSRVLSYVDAAALILIITAVLYFLGYVYYYSFFATYGVDINFFTLPFEAYILINWWYDLMAVGLIITVYFLYGLLAFDEREPLRKYPQVRKWIGRNTLGFTLMSTFMVVLFLATWIDQKANRDALSRAGNRKKIELILKTDVQPLPATLYFLSYSGGKYIVYADVPAAGGKPPRGQVYVINDEDVSRITFPAE
jgi:hypothetical protein